MTKTFLTKINSFENLSVIDNNITYSKPTLITNTTGNDSIIIKLDHSGNVSFINWIVGDSNDNMFTDLLFDNNNNLYFCGYISADTIDLNYSLFNKDIQKSGLPLGFIGRYSSENVLEKFIWIGGDQSDYLNGILLDTNNNIHIFGDSNSTSITFDNVNYVNPNPNIVPVENFVLNSLITKTLIYFSSPKILCYGLSL